MVREKKIKRIKKAGKKEISYVCWMYLKSYGMNLNRQTQIIPIINAVIFAINELLKNGIEISISNFGSFSIRETKGRKVKLNGKEYDVNKKRHVHFCYKNKVFH